MSYSYLRKYEILIGEPESYIIPDPESTLYIEETFNVLGQPSKYPDNLNFMAIKKQGLGVSITDLDIEVKVEGNTESKGSNSRSCTVKIYNLSETTAAKITRKNLKFILKGGYQSDLDRDALPIIFAGQIKSATRFYEGVNSGVELEVGDGYLPSTSIKISKNLKSTESKLVSARDVFDYLVSVWNINGISSSTESLRYDELPIPLEEVLFKGGWNGEGYLRDIMDDVCEWFNYKWYIVNNTLYIQAMTSPNFRAGIEVTPLQIKKASYISSDSKVDGNTKSPTRVEFSLFLEGRITEDKFIKVIDHKSKPNYKFKGEYKILSVSHRMDTRSNYWDTIVECEKI